MTNQAVNAPLIIFLVALASTAHGREPDTSSASVKSRAILASGEADRKMAVGDCRAAATLYKEALDLVPSPPHALNCARAQAQCGRLTAALANAIFATKAPLPDGSDSEPAVWSQARSDAVQFAHELEARIPTLRILVQGITHTDSVRVVIDGRETAREWIEGVPQRVDPGEHDFVVSTAGSMVSRSVVVREREIKVVKVTLGPPLSQLFWSGAIGGGAAVMAASVAGIVSVIKTSEAKEQCQGNNCISTAQSNINEAKTWAWISDGALVAAALGGAVASYAFWTRPRSQLAIESEPRAVLQFGPGELQMKVRF